MAKQWSTVASVDSDLDADLGSTFVDGIPVPLAPDSKAHVMVVRTDGSPETIAVMVKTSNDGTRWDSDLVGIGPRILNAVAQNSPFSIYISDCVQYRVAIANNSGSDTLTVDTFESHMEDV